MCAAFVAEIFQIIGKQTNGSELNANRVEMKTAQHFCSIRQTNIGASLEKRGKDISRWLLRMPAAGWYNGNSYWSALAPVRDTAEVFNDSQKTDADTNLLDQPEKKDSYQKKSYLWFVKSDSKEVPQFYF